MLSNIIGAAIGSAVDRSDGEGGLTGAAVGAITVSVLKRAIPLALLVGGVFAIKSALEHRSSPAQ